MGMFQHLAGNDFINSIPWDKIFVFWSDERSVAPDHPDSNYRMAADNLLNHVPVPAGHIFRMEAENPALEDSANNYSSQISKVDPDHSLDLIFLGMGPDGHTASLFPHTKALSESKAWVVGNHVPRLNTNRMTFTYRTIQAGRKVVFLAAGKDKAPALKEVWEGKPNLEEYPSQGVTCPNSDCLWVVDKDAAANLTQNHTIGSNP